MTDNISIFSDIQTNDLTDENLNIELDLSDPKGLRDALVGDGKKFANDDELAKSKIYADRQIMTLEQELKALRQKQAQDKTVSDLLEALKKNNLKTDDNKVPVQEGDDLERRNSPVALNPEDVISKVLEELDTRNKAQKEIDNINLVKSVLGRDLKTKVMSLMDTYGLDQNYIDALSRSNPNALFKLMGVDPSNKEEKQTQSSAPAPTRLETSRLDSRNGLRNNNFYEELKKKDSRKFWSAEVQAQRIKDYEALGDKFFQ